MKKEAGWEYCWAFIARQDCYHAEPGRSKRKSRYCATSRSYEARSSYLRSTESFLHQRRSYRVVGSSQNFDGNTKLKDISSLVLPKPCPVSLSERESRAPDVVIHWAREEEGGEGRLVGCIDFRLDREKERRAALANMQHAACLT